MVNEKYTTTIANLEEKLATSENRSKDLISLIEKKDTLLGTDVKKIDSMKQSIFIYKIGTGIGVMTSMFLILVLLYQNKMIPQLI